MSSTDSKTASEPMTAAEVAEKMAALGVHSRHHKKECSTSAKEAKKSAAKTAEQKKKEKKERQKKRGESGAFVNQEKKYMSKGGAKTNS